MLTLFLVWSVPPPPTSPPPQPPPSRLQVLPAFLIFLSRSPALLVPPPGVCRPALTAPPPPPALWAPVPVARAGRGPQSSRAHSLLGWAQSLLGKDKSGEPAPRQRPQTVPVGSKEPSQDQLHDLGGPVQNGPLFERRWEPQMAAQSLQPGQGAPEHAESAESLALGQPGAQTLRGACVGQGTPAGGGTEGGTRLRPGLGPARPRPREQRLLANPWPLRMHRKWVSFPWRFTALGLAPSSLASGPFPGRRPTLSFPGHFGAIKSLVWLNLKLPSQIQFHVRLVPSRRAAQPCKRQGQGTSASSPSSLSAGSGGRGAGQGTPKPSVSSFFTAHPHPLPAPSASWVAPVARLGVGVGGGGSLWPPLQL